ncbi:PREDICTED: G2/mitotic-specific cyclin-B-like isoform X2 [Branchiostoma belcheri]|uniref:G2/mitotic-specific cyclin-B-like isoform X2 n=1 Tax=Branchiostoma belcheri TaxID=7741 RepID=A0A6P4YLX9_BRABE|nr:PREDICTED: G2/mitotic-specific cyclin-B-like isoform X2 [Branchiostoma belcheri]
MALRTRSASAATSQNENILAGKALMAKNKMATGRPRAALASIGNKEANIGKVAAKDVMKKKTLPKSRGTTALPEAVKENVTAKKQPTKEKTLSPAPMEVDPMDMTEMKKAFSDSLMAKVEDIDSEDKENPQLCTEFVNDIYEYLRHVERKYKVNPNYLDGQVINARMRGILIDWLIQVHLRFHLLQETLFLTVDIIDRFLQSVSQSKGQDDKKVQSVSRSKLQLVGVTAMLIASKYEEMYAPEVADFVYITDNAYTKSQIRSMEILILKNLNFNLGKPLPLHFLRRNSKAGQVDAQKHTLAKYLMEMSLVDYDMVQYNPSQIAAAALCLSAKTLDQSEWTPTLEYYSTYSEEDLLPIMRHMAKNISKSSTSKLQAVRNKYTSSKFLKIATIPELKSDYIQELAEKSS